MLVEYLALHFSKHATLSFAVILAPGIREKSGKYQGFVGHFVEYHVRDPQPAIDQI